jgi:carbon storage regulator
MLVLSRKRGESIQVGDGITVTILRVAGGKVRLGVEAPNHLRVLRTELLPEERQPPRSDAA